MRELCIWHLAGERGGFKERNIISGLCCRSLSFFTSIQILTDYPEELRGDVSLHLHKEILSLPLFETASEGCRKLLSLTIKVGLEKTAKILRVSQLQWNVLKSSTLILS